MKKEIYIRCKACNNLLGNKHPAGDPLCSYCHNWIERESYPSLYRIFNINDLEINNVKGNICEYEEDFN